MKVPVPQRFVDMVNRNGGHLVITSATPVPYRIPHVGARMLWENDSNDDEFETTCCVYAMATREEYLACEAWGGAHQPLGYYYKLSFD